MNKIEIKVKVKSHLMPKYGTLGAAGSDLMADLREPLTLDVGERALVPTSLYLELPDGYEAQVRPRSGLAVKHGVTVLNAPGTVDCDYRGEVKVPIINLGQEPFTIQPGDRIAQMVIAPVIQADFIQTQELSSTERGSGGFGSTGR